MGMMINRRRVCGGKSLPYDVEIEYLKCTGTQYINLGFKPTNNIQIDVVFSRSNNNIRFDCAAENGWSTKIVRCIIIENTDMYWRNHYNSPTDTIIDSIYLIGDVRIVCNGRTATAYNLTNGSTVGSITNPTTTSFTADENFYVFGMGYKGSCYYDSAQNGLKLYSIKIVDNGVNFDLIPVRIGQVGYLYDKVSGRLFGNSGTGSFILGPDI
jgi:hypothetical protein